VFFHDFGFGSDKEIVPKFNSCADSNPKKKTCELGSGSQNLTLNPNINTGNQTPSQHSVLYIGMGCTYYLPTDNLLTNPKP